MRACITVARERPRMFLVGLVVSVLLGLGVGHEVLQYRISLSPKLEALNEATLVTRASTNAYWFIATYDMGNNPRCTRNNTYTLYRDDLGDERMYYTLATHANGDQIPYSTTHYRMLFFLPMGFPEGEWNFIVGTRYSCPPFNLVTLYRSSEPRVLRIPPTRAEGKE